MLQLEPLGQATKSEVPPKKLVCFLEQFFHYFEERATFLLKAFMVDLIQYH